MNLVSATTEIDRKDQVNLRPAHNHIEAVYNDGGEPANTSSAVALLRLRKECSDVPAFPPATVSPQPPDDRIAVLNNTIKRPAQRHRGHAPAGERSSAGT
jgi:hypothetical protein